jgi:endonuclease YncB( thermonuclease family)
VDCPETDLSFPERVAEQADYWGISEASAVRLGHRATAFTRGFLKGPFTVYTKKEDARGRSEKRRYFAMVEAGGVFLTEALLTNGLARANRADTAQPDGTKSRTYWQHLRQVELKAKREKRGGWGEPKKRPSEK